MSKKRVRYWVEEMRVPFLTASVVPVVLGSVMGWYHTGVLYWGYFFLALLGGVCLHIGTNVCNDYFDHRNRSDEVNVEFVRPFSGGSRMIQRGRMTPKAVLTEGLIFFGLGILIGLYLAWTRGGMVLVLGLIGVFSGYFYTAPPFELARRGIGELIVGINFGTLMVLGAYYVQTGSLSWEAAVLSVPIALLIALVLWINEFPDYAADKAVGKNTLVVRLGRRTAARGYIVVLMIVYLWIVGAVVLGVTPAWALSVLLSFPIAIKAIGVVRRYYENIPNLISANAGTILIHLLVGVFLSVSYVLDRVL